MADRLANLLNSCASGNLSADEQRQLSKIITNDFVHDYLHGTDSESDCTDDEACGDFESVESDSDEPVVRFHRE